MGLFIGLFSSIVAGILNGSFAAPMKKIKHWEWENTWFIYAVVALLLLPVVTGFMSVPNLMDVYARAGHHVILATLVTGFLYGIGSLTFGLGLYLAGLSMGYSVMIGIIAVTGSLVPMLILSPESIATTGGIVILLAMAVCLAGVIYCARAGSLREQSQATNEPSKSKKSFKMALIVCIISGLFSAMLNISLVVGLPIADLAVIHLEGPLSAFRSYNAVWLLTLVGAFIPYIFYCVFLFVKNRSAQKYASEPLNFMRAAFMGLIWFTCIALYGAGASQLGRLGTTVGWIILMAVTVIVGNLWGFFTGEWDNSPATAKVTMAKGITLLLLSVVMVAIGRLYY